jgi:ornithine--oxo-acid transaminase
LFVAVEVEKVQESGGNGKRSAYDICRRLLDLGVLAKPTHENKIRFSPPLIIKREEVDVILGKMERVLKEM